MSWDFSCSDLNTIITTRTLKGIITTSVTEQSIGILTTNWSLCDRGTRFHPINYGPTTQQVTLCPQFYEVIDDMPHKMTITVKYYASLMQRPAADYRARISRDV